jgi:hypothetical protein
LPALAVLFHRNDQPHDDVVEPVLEPRLLPVPPGFEGVSVPVGD